LIADEAAAFLYEEVGEEGRAEAAAGAPHEGDAPTRLGASQVAQLVDDVAAKALELLDPSGVKLDVEV